MKIAFCYALAFHSKQFLMYLPGLFSGTMLTYIFLIIIFIPTYYSFVELFNYYLRQHRMQKEYDKIPLSKRMFLIPILKTEYFDICKHKKHYHIFLCLSYRFTDYFYL